jgi:DNA-binding MarR family transcriptional regulator
MRKKVEFVNQSAGEASPEALFEALHEIMHLHRAQLQRAIEGGGWGVSPLEARVLGFFARSPGATLTDLVAHSGRDKSQLARMIGSLRERGLLDARPDAHDRRNLRLALTPQAEGIHQDMRARMQRMAKAAVVSIDKDERARLLAALRKLAQGLQSEG